MSGHTPVMLAEVLDVLHPRDGEIYIDATFGGGGYSAALLASAACRVYAIDRDPTAIARGAELAAGVDNRLVLIEGRFSQMESLIAARGGLPADGIAFDLGVSSFQFDQPERGFSFREDGPLDMRMGGAAEGGMSAADVVNTFAETELADILWRYGEERRSRAIARAIVKARPFLRTRALAELIEKTLGPAARKQSIHPATKTFQALRIYVNDELGELERGLEAAERSLKPKGRLAVVSFHSLEDRIVKQFLARRAGKLAKTSRHAPEETPPHVPSFTLLPPSPRMPGLNEIAANPRSRSARLRAAERTSEPAWTVPDASIGGHA
jgi:16S rRNA (cytosine1402-N4)-methyltransferase